MGMLICENIFSGSAIIFFYCIGVAQRIGIFLINRILCFAQLVVIFTPHQLRVWRPHLLVIIIRLVIPGLGYLGIVFYWELSWNRSERFVYDQM